MRWTCPQCGMGRRTLGKPRWAVVRPPAHRTPVITRVLLMRLGCRSGLLGALGLALWAGGWLASHSGLRLGAGHWLVGHGHLVRLSRGASDAAPADRRSLMHLASGGATLAGVLVGLGPGGATHPGGSALAPDYAVMAHHAPCLPMASNAAGFGLSRGSAHASCAVATGYPLIASAMRPLGY